MVYFIISIAVSLQILFAPLFISGLNSAFDPLTSPANHAIYIAVVEINHKSRATTAEVVIKVFTNDLEDALFNAYKKHTKLESEDNCEAHGLLFEKYFSTHFSCVINDQERQISFKNCEKNEDTLWLRFDMTCPERWNNLRLTADFLMELFPTQSNVISVFHGDKKKYFRLTNSKKSRQIRFAD